MISIIIPIYNQAEKLNRCLKSVFNQTLKDFEVIVVSDGSTDNLLSVIRPWKTKIRFFQRQNKGAPAARNFGASRANGEWLLFCDADIILEPNMLEEMMTALEKHPEVGYAYSSFKFGWKKFKLWPFDRRKLKNMPCIHTTSLIRRHCFPGFDESLKKFQDWDLFLTMAENGYDGFWLDKVLFKVSSGGTISRWLPKWLYWIFFLKRVRTYNTAKEIVKKKHNLI